jgi:hypothetical protein
MVWHTQGLHFHEKRQEYIVFLSSVLMRLYGEIITGICGSKQDFQRAKKIYRQKVGNMNRQGVVNLAGTSMLSDSAEKGERLIYNNVGHCRI